MTEKMIDKSVGLNIRIGYDFSVMNYYIWINVSYFSVDDINIQIFRRPRRKVRVTNGNVNSDVKPRADEQEHHMRRRLKASWQNLPREVLWGNSRTLIS